MNHEAQPRRKRDVWLDGLFWVAPVALPLLLLGIAAFINAANAGLTQGIEWIALILGMIQGASFIPGIRATLGTRIALAIGYFALMPFVSRAFFSLVSGFFDWLMPSNPFV